MKFTNRISHSLFFVKGAGGLKLRWIVVCALLAAATSLAQFNQPRPRLAQAEQTAALQGDAALRHLKTDGSYASLAAALAAARSQINAAPANNPILTRQQKLTAADGAANVRFGSAVAISGDTVVIGAPDDDVAGEDQGSVYVFTRNGGAWTPQQKITADDGAANDGFGFSVAINGDTLVAGSPVDGVGANAEQGSAYVFTRSGGVWTLQQKLSAVDGAAGDFFGLSVALSGDTVVAGAFFGDVGANSNQGSAYVFTRNGAVWTQQQKLTAIDGEAGDFFGRSVAISGDTVVVGAITDKIGANFDQGSAYVFTRSGGAWTQRQKLTADDGAAGDQFGLSVAISGDTVVVGAPDDDIGGNFDLGSAYVFVRSGAIWTQQQKLTAGDGAVVDFFGVTVAISGDTVVVGAEDDDIDGSLDQGSVYVFSRNGATWTQRRQPIADDGAANDLFGSAIAISGDTVVVGAPRDDIGANKNQGAAYVFVIRAGNLVQQQQFVANDGATDDEFGSSVAISGDTVLVGAPRDDIGANADQGSAYVFIRSGDSWTLQQKLMADDGAANDGFGRSVAVNGDTVVVGASNNDGAFKDQGAAYVFVRNGATWTRQQKLIAADAAAGDIFGVSVAISGDTVVVGAPFDGIDANRAQGSVYVFTRRGAVWMPQQKLTADDGATDDLFGASVALSGETVVVGAEGDDIGANEDQGSAYVFTRNVTAWTQQKKLTAGDGAAFDRFGKSVALGGDTVVVGASNKDGAFKQQGAAYVFHSNGATWTQQQKLIAEDGAATDVFGASVALSGDTVVVGALNDTIGANAIQGSAYVFTRSGANWTPLQKLTANDGAALDQFGLSVAVSGDTVIVGAVNDDIGASANQGSAYVFISPACPTIALDPATLPDGVVGASYNQTVTASGAEPYQFSLSDGALPPGLTLSQSGQITGAPTTAGVYSFTITATILSNLCPGSRSYTLTIASPACQFSVAPTNHAFSPQGGNGVINVNADVGCAWTAVSNDPFITITSGANGSGNGVVMFAVSQNPNPGSRRGTLTVAGRRVTVAQAAPVAGVSAASFIGTSLATESIVAAFGSGLAKSTEVATTQPLPTTLGGTQVSVLDSQGTERLAPLFFISPGQINFQVPPGTATGQALVTIIQDGAMVAAASPQIAMVSPGLFSANASGQGLVIGVALRVKADGTQSFEPVVNFDEEKRQFVAAPINLDSPSDNVFLVLFGTGLRNRSALSAVDVKIGGVNAEAIFAGPQGSFVGLDQLNVSLPRSLAGRGEVDVAVTIDGHEANRLKVAIK